jgi:1-pyrroline-5-carboxylate dehydrogenase
MSLGIFRIPVPQNEPVRDYAPGSPERASLVTRLEQMAREQIDIPLIIGGKEIRTGNTEPCVMPHNHSHVLGHYHQADDEHVNMAIAAASQAWKSWSEMAWEDRAAVLWKAAELLAGPWRDTLNAATMLCQSKTVYQAEIDSACELIDFLRFNAYFMQQIVTEQPMYSPYPNWNRSEYRALEGFVFAITPFNFTAIGGNLPTAPAVMGNTVLWKPASSTVFTNYYTMRLFEAAGFPPGVINFVPGPSSKVGKALEHPELAGVHFTGSTGVFHKFWGTIGTNIHRYRGYPRIVGETGGKDFIFAHESADREALKVAIVRGAFEFQGQKCSAASRAYVPENVWAEIKDELIATVNAIAMGDPRDFTNFMGAVIDRKAFRDITGYIEYCRQADDATIIAGGSYDDQQGYFIRPTIVETRNPKFRTMCEEIFGPVITVYPYDPAKFEETLALCDDTSPYALTGAIFAQDRQVIVQATQALRHAAGNFYINDKPTGAVVGQQPFGGARASGTNDKAGSALNLLRWTSVRSIKENFNPPKNYRYPFMG